MPNHLHGLILLPTDLPEARVDRRSTLSSIIGTFKGAVTREAGEKRLWRGFHDRVVRDQAELERIRGYILMNPERCAGDGYNPRALEAGDDLALWE